ncbi:MAG: hypothetical protein ABI813_12685 [Bacteroidota bacterium]
MYTSKKHLFLLFLTAILAVNKSFGQTNVKIDSNRVRKSFVLQLGGGFGSYTAVVHIKPPALSGSIRRYSAVGTIRLMWYPSYRLRFGFETGYTDFYSYKVKNGNTTGSLHLSAVPLLFVFSMQVVKRVNIYAGIGAYSEATHLNYDGTLVSRALVLGSNIALSYTWQLSDRLGIMAEAEWMNAYDTRDASLNLQTKLAWRFLQWR